MKKEVNTFHSGRYLFNDEAACDLSVISEALNIFCRMPLFPETVAEYKTDQTEKAVLGGAKLEGSSVTLGQVKSIVVCPRENFSQDTMAIEVINIFSAYRFIDSITDRALSPELIASLHRELVVAAPNLKDIEGSYRKGGVKADEAWLSVQYAPPASPLDINFLIKHLMEWIENDLKDVNPLIRAFLLHLHLKKIQPYYNANGHTARLMEAWYLNRHGFRFIQYLLPLIYNVNRTEYYRTVSEFYASSDITAFIEFISGALSKTVADIRDRNFRKYADVISAGYLNRLLDEKVLIKRQFDLLTLVREQGLVFSQEDLQLRKPFTKLYGTVSRTTVSRDIKKFEELGLIVHNGSGYIFNSEIFA